jgi:hypothetical protein
MNACDSRHNELAYKLYLIYLFWLKNPIQQITIKKVALVAV